MSNVQQAGTASKRSKQASTTSKQAQQAQQASTASKHSKQSKHNKHSKQASKQACMYTHVHTRDIYIYICIYSEKDTEKDREHIFVRRGGVLWDGTQAIVWTLAPDICLGP